MRLWMIALVILLAGCSASKETGGFSEPVIAQYIQLAADNCKHFSRLNRVQFSYNQAIKHVRYSHHDYDYFIIDGRYLECVDCPNCYHTDGGYDLKVFVRKEAGPLLLAFNRIVLRYELMDPNHKESACNLKVVVRGNPKTQKDAIYLKFDRANYQAVSRDPDVK